MYAPGMDLVRGVVILIVCTVLWVAVALATKPESDEVLDGFYRRVHPGGWWDRVARRTGITSNDPSAGRMWMGFLLGALFVYASLLGVGYLLTGKAIAGTLLVVVSLGAGALGRAERAQPTRRRDARHKPLPDAGKSSRRSDRRP